uniref:Methyltransferase n=1 Tax=Trypanosoma vivax (strain Y486) TaxID=1055687 RepID=G0U650_TRYVY|nr:conserved hypothetical protein [Trypanosoma vivax Y486]
MSYFSKLSNYRSLGLFLTVGAVSAPVLYNVFGTPSAHRDTTSFDVLDVMEVEEHARYPCVALKGHDVVVWNHYALSARQRNSSSEGRLHGVFSTLGCARTLGGFLALFSNEKHTLVGQCDSAAEENQLHLVREVVGNAREPSQTPTSVPTASSISEEADQSLGLTEPLVASSTWPAGRSKYASLTIEPSLDTSLARHGTSLHRWADRATHQSFVRCDPFGPSFVNCYGDASYLGAPYLRVMLSAFLLLPQPLPRLRVAVFGVGGGSLPSFLQRYFSRNISRLDLVDIEPQCFRAAVEDLGMRHEMGGGSVVCPLGMRYHSSRNSQMYRVIPWLPMAWVHFLNLPRPQYPQAWASRRSRRIERTVPSGTTLSSWICLWVARWHPLFHPHHLSTCVAVRCLLSAWQHSIFRRLTPHSLRVAVKYLTNRMFIVFLFQSHPM